MAANGVIEELVTFLSSAGVARISINRADKRNALSLATIELLLSCLKRAEKDPSIKVVILTGTGDKAFAAGVDLDEFSSAFNSATSAREYDDNVTRLYRSMEASRLPIIARMAGVAIGGGCLLALACDLRIAASHVKVGFPVARIGLMLSPHEYRLLLDHVTLSQSKKLLFTGKLLVGLEAVAFGLIDQVVAAEQLDDVVDELAGTIVRGAPLAIAASKRILNAIQRGEGVEQAISQGYSSIYPSKDLAEGLNAIKDKRTPVFIGA